MADKKKFVIKPFRPNAAIDATQAEKIWESLNLAINEIHNKNASSLSFEELYRYVFVTVCRLYYGHVSIM